MTTRESNETEPKTGLVWDQIGEDGFSIAYLGMCEVSVSPKGDAGSWVAVLGIPVPGMDAIEVEIIDIPRADMEGARRVAETLPAAEVDRKIKAIIAAISESAANEERARIVGRVYRFAAELTNEKAR